MINTSESSIDENVLQNNKNLTAKTAFHPVIHKALIKQTDNTIIQFFRYAIVGGFAFVIDFGLLYFFTNHFKIHYLVSAALSFTVGLVANYILSKLWVFNKASIQNKIFEFGVFTIIGVIGLFLNELFIWFFTDKAHIYYLTSKILTAFFVFFWNFFARKFTLFK